MAVDPLSLPPPQFIVPNTGHRLAAAAVESKSSVLNVQVFNPDKDEQKVC